MNRIELIQEIFKNTNFEYYLEIGCRKGRSFLPIVAKYKMVVDPAFAIPLLRKLRWAYLVPENANNQYFEEESDTFFKKRKNVIKQLDVVLVDGLHTFRNSLNDVLNSLKYLNENGIIIMHDCLPPNKAAATPTKFFPTKKERKAMDGWTNQWCGDVYKSIIYLLAKYPDTLKTCVVNTDYGLGIVRPKADISNLDWDIDEALFSKVSQMTYDDLMKDPKVVINLQDAEYLHTIIEEMKELPS
ncbi:MAG: hypothetical protein ACI9IP_000299 [Arcticibacterium sp.]|jgi:hypothetical protein